MLLGINYIKANGEEGYYRYIFGFTFKKEAFTPYTTFSAVVAHEPLPEDIHEVSLSVENNLVHQGIVDSYKVIEEKGYKRAIITSRGYTSLLTDNQLAPGMYTNISLNKLFTDYFVLPKITHEDNNQISYIYVNKGTAMWDGAANLTYKLMKSYPYIRKANTVMMSMPSDAKNLTYNDDKILARGSEMFSKRMVSHYHMADLNGTYDTFKSVSDEAVSRNIIRHHHFELDRRFLNNPQSACDFRTMMSMRAYKRKFLKYNGYRGEDLNDIVTYGDMKNKRINAVSITGNAKGVFTEISVYES